MNNEEIAVTSYLDLKDEAEKATKLIKDLKKGFFEIYQEGFLTVLGEMAKDTDDSDVKAKEAFLASLEKLDEFDFKMTERIDAHLGKSVTNAYNIGYLEGSMRATDGMADKMKELISEGMITDEYESGRMLYTLDKVKELFRQEMSKQLKGKSMNIYFKDKDEKEKDNDNE